jgi:ribonuclease HII
MIVYNPIKKDFDNSFLTKEIKFIAGADEVGRGPLAGPVVAASVIFSPDIYIEGVNDSKQLTGEEREELVPEIIKQSLACSVSAVSHIKIDKINILQASLLAMAVSVSRLKIKPDLVLIDGNKTFNHSVPSIPIIKGDAQSFAIAAASILAKVARDRVMKRMCPRFPQYLWSKNKGYATREHIEAIKTFGPSIFHRKTFLRKILYEEPEFEFAHEDFYGEMEPPTD